MKKKGEKINKEVENVENNEVNVKKKHKSSNTVGVRVVAGVLAFLMVASLTTTVVAYFI